MSEQSDTELVLLARQGDKAVFNQLVWRYQPMARHVAERIISNKNLAQELVQDAILQAYLSLPKLRNPNSFRSWLYGIVLNVCRNYLRRRKLISFSLETMIEDLGTEPLPIDGGTPEPQLICFKHFSPNTQKRDLIVKVMTDANAHDYYHSFFF